MKKYILVNDFDGNEMHELEATRYIEALEEALESLGWYLTKEDK